MIHAQAPTKALARKVYGWTDTITRNNEPFFKFVLWFVLGMDQLIINYYCRPELEIQLGRGFPMFQPCFGFWNLGIRLTKSWMASATWEC